MSRIHMLVSFDANSKEELMEAIYSFAQARRMLVMVEDCPGSTRIRRRDGVREWEAMWSWEEEKAD